MNSRRSTRKRVVIRKLDKGLIKGYIDTERFVGLEIELLDREGRVIRIPLKEIKGVFFVREFDGDRDRPERKIFRSRPRLAGLWVRMSFHDNEILEALLPSNLLELDALGFMVSPPDVYSNNLKIFVPRTALTKMEVLGVISDGVVKRMSQRTAQAHIETATGQQVGLFTSGAPAETK